MTDAPVPRHAFAPDAVLEGGDLDCGSGLLLLIRGALDPLPSGRLLEVRSTETSVEQDLPAWCRLTGNALVSWTRAGARRSFLVSKGAFDVGGGRRAVAEAPTPAATPAPAAAGAQTVAARAAARFAFPVETPVFADAPPPPRPAPSLPPLAVMGIGSWPRPAWLLRALHERLSGRLSPEEFEATADDAVRLAVQAQERAGVDVVVDGEQRRDNYASFVGDRLQNCRLVPLVDLLPLVDDPDNLARDFASLDVPADKVRHPVAFGPLGRSRPLALHEARFLATVTRRPRKVALPGPYLLARTLWLECLADRAYASREALAADVVRVLREEIAFLLADGVDVVQLDEPVLTEVVHGRPAGGRSFMCGALSAKGESGAELAFARDLINEVVRGAPRERLALHVCRGNWTRDVAAALTGDYRPLIDLLGALEVGALLLEMCTPRAGEAEILRELPRRLRLGLGMVDQKSERIESADDVARRLEASARLFGADRLLLVPDCGFATFADNPVASAAVAERKLAAMVAGRARFLGASPPPA
ncbi:MAG TPA: 5-methyltetrahydropteroyltriglutamate--homocysteine methyltransferase [Planctomycetota bacterium]|nr:5-methyltetrahydropteroyltriglutamate--homocysteine methyltransferase [Planctomycetota bacterium]